MEFVVAVVVDVDVAVVVDVVDVVAVVFASAEVAQGDEEECRRAELEE